MSKKRLENPLIKLRELLKHAEQLDEEGRKKLFFGALEIANNVDLQNATYAENFWNEMNEVDGGNDTPNELPNSVGEFGRDVNNPIPVNGTLGEVTYLSRLIWNDEKKPQFVTFHRLGSRLSDKFDRLIDIFEVLTIDGENYDILYLDMYHVNQSKKAPKNYKLADKQIVGITGECMGPNSDFPKGTLERTFQYAMTFLGAPIVNPLLHTLNFENGFKTAQEHRNKNLIIEATSKLPGMKLPDGFVITPPDNQK